MRALLFLSLLSRIAAAYFQKFDESVQRVQIDAGARQVDTASDPRAAAWTVGQAAPTESVNRSGDPRTAAWKSNIAVVVDPNADPRIQRPPLKQAPQSGTIPQVFEPTDVFIIDFMETLTATCLWAYLGGSFGKDPTTGGMKAPVKQGSSAATIALKLGKTEEDVLQYVNPNHEYWTGKERENKATQFQMAVLQHVDKEDFVRRIWGGWQRVASLHRMFQGIGKENIWLLTNAYKEVILEALRKVGLADDILPTQIIARDQGPYDRHLFLEANELLKMKINLQTDERAKAFFAEIGMPKGPEGNDTAYAIKKHPVIQMMRKEWLLKPTQKALFVDDNPDIIAQTIDANEWETTGVTLTGAWLVIGRADPVCNPENMPQKGGLSEQEMEALVKCRKVAPSPGGPVVGPNAGGQCTRPLGSAVCPTEPCPDVAQAPAAALARAEERATPGSGAVAAALLLYLWL